MLQSDAIDTHTYRAVISTSIFASVRRAPNAADVARAGALACYSRRRRLRHASGGGARRVFLFRRAVATAPALPAPELHCCSACVQLLSCSRSTDADGLMSDSLLLSKERMYAFGMYSKTSPTAPRALWAAKLMHINYASVLLPDARSPMPPNRSKCVLVHCTQYLYALHSLLKCAS